MAALEETAPLLFIIMELIEQDYLVAYWDQRGSGLSDTYLNEKNICFDLYINDLKEIILHLKEN